MKRLWLAALLLVVVRAELGAAGPHPVWRRVAFAPCDSAVVALGIDPVSGSLAYLSDSCGLFRADPAEPRGYAPTPIHSPAISIVVAPTDEPTLYIISFGNPGPIRSLSNHELNRSRDGGATWANMLLSIRSVVVDPGDPATVYAGAAPSFSFFAEGAYKTVDSGEHWAVSTDGLSRCRPELLYCISVTQVAISRTDPTILYAVSNGGIFRSGDAGATWSEVFGVDSYSCCQALAVDPDSPATVYATYAVGRLLRTDDAGSSWREFPIGGYTFGPVVVDPLSRSLFAATDTGVLRSDDRGEHWAAFSEGLTGGQVWSLALSPMQVLYAGTGDGVFAISTAARTRPQRPLTRTVPPRQ